MKSDRKETSPNEELLIRSQRDMMRALIDAKNDYGRTGAGIVAEGYLLGMASYLRQTETPEIAYNVLQRMVDRVATGVVKTFVPSEYWPFQSKNRRKQDG